MRRDQSGGNTILRKTIAFAAVSAIALALSASASSAQTSEFSGFYLGIHGAHADFLGSPNFEIDGGAFGLHAGYNHVSGALLLGVEGDYEWSDASYKVSSVGFSTEVDVEYFGSIRGRAGWLVSPNALLFATAGYSWSELHATVTFVGFGTQTKTTDVSGAVVGGGIEYKFLQNFSGRVEGLRYWAYDSGDKVGEMDVIRAGLSYHFK
jgi:outer membrane immunogenic protein